MAIHKGRIQFAKSYQLIEISVSLGFRVWKDELFSLRGVVSWDLNKELAYAAKRALINLISISSGKKKRLIYFELLDDVDSPGIQEVDLYVPGLRYGEYTLTIMGEQCLHVNRVLSWLYDSNFRHGMVLDILNANKRRNSDDE